MNLGNTEYGAIVQDWGFCMNNFENYLLPTTASHRWLINLRKTFEFSLLLVVVAAAIFFLFFFVFPTRCGESRLNVSVYFFKIVKRRKTGRR
jgi:hypothetical protein